MDTEGSYRDKININDKIDAIWISGYLLERRVATFLQNSGYKAVTNRGFYDTENNKSREYDVYAYKEFQIYEGTNNCKIYPTLICECKNNSLPIVFFVQDDKQFEPLIDEIRVSGIPSKIWQQNKYISVQEFSNIAKFHHYCQPKAPIATQCCTFERRGSNKATHDTELHETYRTVTKALENEIDDDYKVMNQWFAPEELGKQFIDLSIYPL
jgi:hypothetical protein